MSKKDEALKLAQDLRALADRFSEGWHDGIKIDASDIVLLSDAAEALAEQPAQGCEFCSHPLYAGTKCKNCGREQPAQQDMPKIGCVNHDCGQCKAQQQQEPVAVVDANDDGYWAEILPDRNVKVGQLLYTSPPASKPLTDEQLADILPDDDTPMSLGEAFVKFARAIEAAHGIKE